jgi:hypothetical protein
MLRLFHARSGRIGGMNRRLESNAPAVLAAIAVLLLVISTTSYVVGYFALCDAPRNGPVLYRTYQKQWQATLFGPAAYVESLSTGSEVETAYWSWGGGD